MTMLRQHTLALVAALLAAAATAPAIAAAPQRGDPAAIQRETVMVRSPVVRLGDLFLNVDAAKADTPVAYAPAPGRRALFDARWLHRVAHSHGLDWRPAGIQDNVTVERESTVIGREEIEQHILSALEEQGVDTGQTRVHLSNRMLRVHLPAGVEPTVDVEDVAFDERRGHFNAVVTVSAERTPPQRVRVTGQIHEMVDVPVLARPVAAGEVLSADDIRWTTVRGQTLQKNVVLAADDLVGMTPKRTLRAGAPISGADISRPIMVGKGEIVIMAVQTPQMLLTARGQALTNGGKGDVIRIANIQSRNIVEAVVTGPGQVAVGMSFSSSLH